MSAEFELDDEFYNGDFQEYCLQRGYVKNTDFEWAYRKEFDNVSLSIVMRENSSTIRLRCITNKPRPFSNAKSPTFNLENVWSEILRNHSELDLKELHLYTPVNFKSKLKENNWKSILPDVDLTLHNDNGLFYSERWLHRKYEKEIYFEVHDLQPCNSEDYIDRLRGNHLL